MQSAFGPSEQDQELAETEAELNRETLGSDQGRYLACDCSFGSLVTPEVSLVTPVVSVVLSVGSPLSFDVVSTVRAVLFCVSCC